MRFSMQEQEAGVLELTEISDVRDLVLFNDDVNTFDHVISTLVRVCRHTPEQAEQCATIVHYRGKCTVKNGTLEELRPMRDAICEAGIDARIL
ncbi:MAG: ATP-dependent Clp protease adaptor ClpS [Bacteroidota bacterium]